ncbi:DNA-directed RNA polymerase subunit delta [Mycoplasma sp. 394]|uniref:DNA-directed RNA polymerase subunit delta n=1 Tax=Mycoplasma sp. 6243 TaxID=3440865 RepID=UPI003EBE2149
MKNTTMLEVAIEKVNSNPLYSFTFAELFDAVEKELKDNWYFRFVKGEPNLPYEKVRETKMGELYRLLTVDKRFHRNIDGSWRAAN